MSLSVDDFEAFHQAVHSGRKPFDWQDRLLRQIVSERAWPRVLDLPTGSGKTTCIDIALFALALDSSTPPRERWCPRRIAMVVDRRVVVDQAAERGHKLLNALTTSSAHEVIAVREALASLAGPDDEPLGVFTLRGGIPKDDGWARTPDQPLVIASTVDQVGSRLLIQGYGVSPGMRPVHAGLAGNDMLILLDEVHLSQPFKQTLERLGRLRERYRGNGLPQRFQFAFLSATPGDAEGARFELSPAELAPECLLGPRLYAKKPTRIVEVSGREDLAKRVASEAKSLTGMHDVVAAVVNRVDTALSVFSELKEMMTGEADVILVTGRMRPLDRDDVLAVYKPLITAGMRTRSGAEGKLVVVGTQCIEAGADFDFDAMVTESASFDSLRQRFGRVNRLGEYKDGEGDSKAEGVIAHDEAAEIPKRDKSGKVVRKGGQVVMVKGDPIYGDTIIKTIKWLQMQGDKAKGRKSKASQTMAGAGARVDFGSRALLDAPGELLSPKESAPTLLPAYLDLWSQTAPEPFTVPEPGLFLHGPRSGPDDVQIIWRTDLDDSLFESESTSVLVSAVAAVRPSSLEAISLPFVAARRWLAQTTRVIAGTADLEASDEAQRDTDSISGGRRALRWRGDKSEIVDASQVRPGDTLIVPSSYGGIDSASRCFDPVSTQEVPDLAERASLMARGRPLLRLHPRVLLRLDLSVDREDPRAARRELAARSGDLSGWKRIWAERLGRGRRTYSVPLENGEDEGWLVISGGRVKLQELRNALGPEGWIQTSIEQGTETTTEDEDSPYVGSEVTLDDHTTHVEERVRGYAYRLGFSDDLVGDLSLAARFHDIGKADRRFQCMLRGGSQINYYRDEGRMLAKSGIPAGSKAERQRAQRLSGYPQGARHEVQSVAMMQAAIEQVAAKAYDLDLVMHLVASHHGHCRPFAPVVKDSQPVDISFEKHDGGTFGTLAFGAVTSAHELHQLDSVLADRFWSMIAKYGWLELCWLETILRLADHRASESEVGD
ncbi:MAG TPA: type I-U CRISPR-associated helicase/endonuclease Cas3 [Terriglobales bacterium]